MTIVIGNLQLLASAREEARQHENMKICLQHDNEELLWQLAAIKRIEIMENAAMVHHRCDTPLQGKTHMTDIDEAEKILARAEFILAKAWNQMIWAIAICAVTAAMLIYSFFYGVCS